MLAVPTAERGRAWRSTFTCGPRGGSIRRSGSERVFECSADRWGLVVRRDFRIEVGWGLRFPTLACVPEVNPRTTADPSTHHPQTERRLGPRSLRMTASIFVMNLWDRTLATK